MEPFTALDDYLAWAESRPDEEHYEVVDGFPVMSPSPSPIHQLAVARLLVLLAAAAPPQMDVLPAPLDWVLWQSPRLQLRQRDLIVVRSEDVASSRLDALPILAIEVLSPTSFERDAVAKRREYALAGLEHYWIVDPATPQLGVYRRSGGQLELVAHAHGEQVVAIDQPFSIRLRPSELVRPRGG
jgi:Uma2 family endonuclease